MRRKGDRDCKGSWLEQILGVHHRTLAFGVTPILKSWRRGRVERENSGGKGERAAPNTAKSPGRNSSR